MTQGWGVCKRLINYLTFNLFLYIFLHNSTIFITFVGQKKYILYTQTH